MSDGDLLHSQFGKFLKMSNGELTVVARNARKARKARKASRKKYPLPCGERVRVRGEYL